MRQGKLTSGGKAYLALVSVCGRALLTGVPLPGPKSYEEEAKPREEEHSAIDIDGI